MSLYSSFRTSAYLHLSELHIGDQSFSNLCNRIGEARMTEEDYIILSENNMNTRMRNAISLTTTNCGITRCQRIVLHN
ncbi:MAG: hypothetical protein MHMPM18_001387 [Marteilia pararefringens]